MPDSRQIQPLQLQTGQNRASTEDPRLPPRSAERYRSQPVQPRLLNLSVFINEHLRDELTLEVLAARMSLSPFHFHRKFRAYFGESLHQHIKRLRLERSAHALLYRLTPVSAVARGSGYKTLSAFSHAFSAHFGVAPTRFREVMLMGRLSELEAGLRERLGSEWVDRLEPVRIETLPERPLGFLRAEMRAADDLAGACAVYEQLRQTIGQEAPVVVASTDLFGILTSSPFRIEIGALTGPEQGLNLPAGAALGNAVLPAGRYAVFNYTGSADHLVDVVRAIYHFWIPRAGERSRASTHFMTARTVAAHGQPTEWSVYVPLEEGTAAAGGVAGAATTGSGAAGAAAAGGAAGQS